MTSYLIIVKEKDLLQQEVEKICRQFLVHPLDITRINKPDEAKPDKSRKTTKSIGIEDVKKMREKIFLKPYKGKTKAVIFEDGQLLTPEAQNALLKVMEEPPAHTIIILTTSNKDAILPTIQSRCSIIELSTTASVLINESTSFFLSGIDQITISKALELAERFDKTKEELPIELEKTIIAIHNKMLQSADRHEVEKLAHTIKELQEALKIITTTNTNKRLTLESTLLSLTE